MSREQRVLASHGPLLAPARGGTHGPVPEGAADAPRDGRGKIFLQGGIGAIVLALILVLIGDEAFSFNIAAAAVLLALGTGLAGFALGAGRKAAAATGAATSRPDVDLQRTLLLTTIPIWVRQLDAVRKEGNRAIEALARSFDEIVSGVRNSLDESRKAVAKLDEYGGIAAQFKASDEDLGGVVLAVQEMHAAKGLVLAEIVRSGRELREISDEVNQLALRSRLLSLNAGIEAARAGEAGRPFAVVVTEMRDLATRTSAASRHIAIQLGQIEAALQSAQLQDEARTDSEVGSISKAESTIAGVMQRFTGMTESLGQSVAIMEGRGAQVREQIADALVALQFQDRVSQILDHTTRNLEKLLQHVEAGTLDEQVLNSWKTEMAAKFSTHEEMASMGVTQGKRVSKDVTFF